MAPAILDTDNQLNTTKGKQFSFFILFISERKASDFEHLKG